MIHDSPAVSVGPAPARAGIDPAQFDLPTIEPIVIVCGLLLVVTILAVSLLSTIGLATG